MRANLPEEGGRGLVGAVHVLEDRAVLGHEAVRLVGVLPLPTWVGAAVKPTEAPHRPTRSGPAHATGPDQPAAGPAAARYFVFSLNIVLYICIALYCCVYMFGIVLVMRFGIG